MNTDPNAVRKERVEARLAQQQLVVAAHAWTTCINCEHFNDETEVCRMYQSKPPARVIALGCLSWEDRIPF